MKKLMTVFLAAAIVFGIAGQSSATTLETSGELRARLWNLGNYLVDGKSAEFWDQRLRLNLNWPVSETVKVNVRADIMEGFWGDSLVTATTTPAVAATATTAAVPAKTTYAATANSRPPIAFDHVNVQFVWPGSPVAIQIGRQDASWGPGFFTKSDNRDRFKITAKFGDTIALYTYDKYIEVVQLHETDSLDDRTQHSAGVISKIGGFNVGLIGAAVLNGSNPNVNSTLYGVGAYAMGKVGPANLSFEIASYLAGKEDLTVGQDVDNSGLMAYLGVSLPAGPVTLGLEGAYAAGDDPGTKDKNEGVAKQDYQGPFWSVILFNNMDYQGYDKAGLMSTDNNFANAIAGKLSVAAAPAKGVSLYGAAVYATRDQVASGSKDMGVEFDVVATYAITPNISWLVGGGYLVAGDFYGDVNDPWGAVSAFTVKF